MSTYDAIGIDLGTKFCRAAVFRDGKVEIIKNKKNNESTPSVVAFRKDDYLIGEDVSEENPADKKNGITSKNVIFNVKRFTGKWVDDERALDDRKYSQFNLAEVGSHLKIEVDCQKRNYYPEEISAILLSEMKDNAEKHLNNSLKKAVITVPASFNNLQRRSTVDAGKLAGFETVQLINKPTAIAISYYHEKDMTGKKVFCVLHLGGGSFDVSIIKIDGPSNFEVESTVGNSHLGGLDFDHRLIDCFVEKCQVEENKNKQKYLLKSLEVRRACEKAKIKLSIQKSVKIEAEGYSQTITRREYEKKCSELYDEMRYHLETLFSKSKLKKHEIDDVLIAGESTQNLKVLELLGVFENENGSYYVNYQKSVFENNSKFHVIFNRAAVCGAAIRAATTSNVEIVELVPSIMNYKGFFLDHYIESHSIILHKGSMDTKTNERSFWVPYNGLVLNIYEEGGDCNRKQLPCSTRTLIEKIDIELRPWNTPQLYLIVKFKYDENCILIIETFVLNWPANEDVGVFVPRLYLTEKKGVEIRQLTIERETERKKLKIVQKSPSRMGIGIDIGTTSSRVAVFHEGRINVLENENGKRTTPSTVKFTEKEILVGEKSGLNVTNSILNVKRLMGKEFNDHVVQSDIRYCSYNVNEENSKPVVEVDARSRSITPEEMSSFILRKMKTIAANFVGDEVQNAVITVPASFDDRQRKATKDAAIIAGFKKVQLINSSTAAVVAYYLENPTIKKRNMFVLSFGGGFIETSVFTAEGSSINMESAIGYNHVGGMSFDDHLICHFIKEFEKKNPGKRISKNKRALYKLREACVEVKRKLSFLKEAEVEITSLFDDEDFRTIITREKFEEISCDLFNKVIRIVHYVFPGTSITKSQIDDILLIGGTTRIPKIQEIIRCYFGGEKKIRQSVNLDEACVYGAAVVAAQLSGVDDKNIMNLSVHEQSSGGRFVTSNGRLSEAEIESIIVEIKAMDLKTEEFKKISEAKNDLEEYAILDQ